MQDAAWFSLTAFTVSLLLGWCLIRIRFVLDRPNVRSLHDAPVPRVGGIAIHASIVATWLAMGTAFPVTLWIAYAMLIAVSALDDMRGAPVLLRLGVHMLSAALVAASMMLPQFGAIAVLIAILALAWMTNLYNFMDGADGLLPLRRLLQHPLDNKLVSDLIDLADWRSDSEHILDSVRHIRTDGCADADPIW